MATWSKVSIKIFSKESIYTFLFDYMINNYKIGLDGEKNYQGTTLNVMRDVGTVQFQVKHPQKKYPYNFYALIFFN